MNHGLRCLTRSGPSALSVRYHQEPGQLEKRILTLKNQEAAQICSPAGPAASGAALSVCSPGGGGSSRGQSHGFLPPLPPAPGTSHRPPPAPRATPRWSPCSTQGCLAAPITPRRCQREAPSAAKTPSRGFRRSWGTSQLHRVPLGPAQLPPHAPALPQPELPGGLELPGFRAGPPPARSPSAHFYSNVVYLVK